MDLADQEELEEKVARLREQQSKNAASEKAERRKVQWIEKIRKDQAEGKDLSGK